MDDKYDGTPGRSGTLVDDCRKVICEVDSFLIDHDRGVFEETRVKYYENYISHLIDLYYANQLIIQRNDNDNNAGNITGVCGYILINKEDEYKVNKIRWTFPDDISSGNILYISFCIISGGDIGGNIHRIRERLVKDYSEKVDEVYWFNMPRNRYFRIKNILKGASYAGDRG